MKITKERIEEYVLSEVKRGLMFPLTDIQIIESDMYDRALNSAKYAYQLASDEKDAIIKKLNSEYADACKPHEDRDLKIYFLQNENARLKEKFEVAVKALEKCCSPEPDGFGSYVAEEFETNDVLEGRKILTKIRDDKEMG